MEKLYMINVPAGVTSHDVEQILRTSEELTTVQAVFFYQGIVSITCSTDEADQLQEASEDGRIRIKKKRVQVSKTLPVDVNTFDPMLSMIQLRDAETPMRFAYEQVKDTHSEITKDIETVPGITTLPVADENLSVQRLWAMAWNELDLAMLRSRYDLTIDEIAVIEAPKVRQRFVGRVEKMKADGIDPLITFSYHGTQEKSINGIADNGLMDDRMGGTDAGWYGRGHYTTPSLPYALAYCYTPRKAIHGKKIESRRINYMDALDVGIRVRVVACFVALGKQYHAKDVRPGSEIRAPYNSHFAYVDDEGKPLKEDSRLPQHATEFVVPRGDQIYPRFVFTVRRVNKMVLWQDPNIFGAENASYAVRIQHENPDIRVYLSLPGSICRYLGMCRKETTQYRLVSNGGQGDGQELLSQIHHLLEEAKIPALIFCRNVDAHKKWASDYSQVKNVSASVADLMAFCQFK
jgi:hypothetical protein